MGGEVAILAVNRHERDRPDDVEHRQQLVPGGVARDVDLGIASVNHPGASAEELIDDPRHRRLVARNRRGGQEDRVTFGDLDVLVATLRHQRKRGERLTLAPRRDQELLLGRKF